MKKPIIFLYLLIILSVHVISQQNQQTPSPTPSQPITADEVVLGVGQIMPGQIDISKTKQAMHFIKVMQLQKKFLFIRVTSMQKIKMAIGIYSNTTRQLIYACQDNYFDTCYVSTDKLKPNSVYVILIMASDNLRYNLYSYWGDVEHLKPNQRLKFMFDSSNPSQLIHLQFENNIQKQVEQIRIILKPEAARVQGQNVKIFANIGFKGEPTITEHQIESMRVWGDSQAIILNKQKFVNEAGISLYIVGNSQTVYILETEFVKNATHELHIGQVINEHMQSNQNITYKINLGQLKYSDLFVIKISSFNGEMTPSLFYDKELTNPFQKNNYQYMGDIQFNIQRIHVKNQATELYLNIKSYDLQTTYQITTQLRQQKLAYEMSENVFEYALLDPLKMQAMYFYSHLWDTSQYQNLKAIRFDISYLSIQGNPYLKYYYCLPQSSDEQCKNISDPKFDKKVGQITDFTKQQVGSKYIVTLTVSQNVYKNINNLQKRLMIIITLYSEGQLQSAAAVEYSSPNQVRLLREGRALEDKVRDRQVKYYKYVNNNPKISEIRIHVNQISGLTRVQGKRTNFLDKSINDTVFYKFDPDFPDTMIIKDNTTQAIYIEVFGLVNSLFTISVTAIHSEHVTSNSLIMAQDVQYEIKLLPYQHMNVQLHPIQEAVKFEFYAEGGMVMICQVDANDLCITDKNKKKMVSSSGQMRLESKDKKPIKLRIGNYIDSDLYTPNAVSKENETAAHLPQSINKVKLTLIYHSASMAHCQQRRVNKVYAENVYSGSCIRFRIPLASELQIMAVRSDLGPTSHIFVLCGKKMDLIQSNDRWIIKKQQVEEICKKNLGDIQLQMLALDDRANDQVKLQYSVQYKGDVVTLLDGVAYRSKGISTPQVSLRDFFYQIGDEDRDINIILYNKKGYQKFYATIVPKSQKYYTAVNEATAKFSSKQSKYYSNPYIKINASEISQFKCGRTCILSLSIYSTQSSGSQFQYALQVTQNHILLKQDHIQEDFLGKGSVKFYEYQSKQALGSIVFRISDNNRRCTRTIMSKNPFPTDSNYYQKQTDGPLIYQKQDSKKSTFYFAVQAIQDCLFTVSISQGESTITKIEYGQYYDINIAQGKQKWFYARHITNTTFKIINLKEHGSIQIFANQTKLDAEAFQSVENRKINRNQFNFKSSYKNTLVVKADDKNFCFDCYYLICIYASKLTSGSIMLGSANTKISINDKKTIFDQIEDINAVTLATFYRVSDGTLLVKVHSGTVNFEITYKNQKFNQSFSQSKKVYNESYNFTKQQSTNTSLQSIFAPLMNTYDPLQIRIRAQKAPAIYSFQLIPSSQSSTYTNHITPGQHAYIFLQDDQSQCITGSLNQKQQEIYVSTDVAQKYMLSTLGIVAKINDEITVDYEKQIVGNILSLRFNAKETFMSKAKNYKICFTAQSKNQTLSLYIFQSKTINLIHSDTEVLVRNQAQFVLHPTTDIILDLFECQGSAQFYYSSTLQKLKQKEAHKLDVIGIPGQSHAIRISSYSTIYLQIVAQMATVLWMPLIQKQDRGVGYFKYAIGSLEYESHFNTITFEIGGVYRVKQTKSKPMQVTYTLFVSDSKQILQAAVMCQKNAPQNIVTASLTTLAIGQNPSYTVSIQIQKQQITNKFKPNSTLYWNAVAQLTVQVAQNPSLEQDHEHYRFIYYQQVVPAEVFRQNKIQQMQTSFMIVFAVVSLVGFLVISFVFVRFIVPAIGKLRNRMLVEEKEDPRDQSVPLPPTSERNERDVVETDERFK